MLYHLEGTATVAIDFLNKREFANSKLATNRYSEDFYDVFNFILNYYIVRLDNKYIIKY